MLVLGLNHTRSPQAWSDAKFHLKVEKDEFLILESVNARLLLAFTNLTTMHAEIEGGLENGEAQYAWRCRDLRTGAETSGAGRVWETLRIISIDGKHRQVEEVSNYRNHQITKDVFSLDWSTGSSNNCWVYYNSRLFTASKVKCGNFFTFPLSGFGYWIRTRPTIVWSLCFSRSGTNKTQP